MADSGYIDWHRLAHTIPWQPYSHGWSTYIAAFWPVDYGSNQHDHGVGLLNREGHHPDWFLHADTADHLLAACPHPSSYVSPNFTDIFTDNLHARPLLASMILGTTDVCYRTPLNMWWASEKDLTRAGRRLLNKLNVLYERRATVVTFVETPTDEASGPRGPRKN